MFPALGAQPRFKIHQLRVDRTQRGDVRFEAARIEPRVSARAVFGIRLSW